jgi:hypothetical protein
MDIHVIVSEWLLFNAKWAIFQIYHGVTFRWDDDGVDAHFFTRPICLAEIL